jgi:hypothetical protein
VVLFPEAITVPDTSSCPQFLPTVDSVPFVDHLRVHDLVTVGSRRILIDTTEFYKYPLCSPAGKHCWRLFEAGRFRPNHADDKVIQDLCYAFSVDSTWVGSELAVVDADLTCEGLSLYELWTAGYFYQTGTREALVSLDLILQKFQLCTGWV